VKVRTKRLYAVLGLHRKRVDCRSIEHATGIDDYLVSLALCCHATDLAASPSESAVMRARLLEYGESRWWGGRSGV